METQFCPVSSPVPAFLPLTLQITLLLVSKPRLRALTHPPPQLRVLSISEHERLWKQKHTHSSRYSSSSRPAGKTHTIVHKRLLLRHHCAGMDVYYLR